MAHSLGGSCASQLALSLWGRQHITDGLWENKIVHFIGRKWKTRKRLEVPASPLGYIPMTQRTLAGIALLKVALLLSRSVKSLIQWPSGDTTNSNCRIHLLLISQNATDQHLHFNAFKESIILHLDIDAAFLHHSIPSTKMQTVFKFVFELILTWLLILYTNNGIGHHEKLIALCGILTGYSTFLVQVFLCPCGILCSFLYGNSLPFSEIITT